MRQAKRIVEAAQLPIVVDRTPVRDRILTKEMLRGRPAMSYLRFSSGGQHEKWGGTSTDRQEEVCDRIVKELALIPNKKWYYQDKGVSGGGKHRRKGQFKEMCRDLAFDSSKDDFPDIIDELTGELKISDIPEGAVLIVEEHSRFAREKSRKTMKLVEKMLSRGIIIYFANMPETPWTLARYDDLMQRTFLAMMFETAFKDNETKSERQSKARRKKRDLVLKRMKNDNTDQLPWEDPPAWIRREGTPTKPSYHKRDGSDGQPNDIATANVLFDLLADAKLSLRDVAEQMNADPKLIWFGKLTGKIKERDRYKMKWAASHIALLAHDTRMLGYRSCYQYPSEITAEAEQLTPGVRVFTGIEAKIFPAAVAKAKWNKVQAVRPRIKRDVPYDQHATNVFTGKLFCHCGKRLQIHWGSDAMLHRTFCCSTVKVGTKATCGDRTKYSLNYFEPKILDILAKKIAPRIGAGNAPKLQRQIDTLATEKDRLDALVAEESGRTTASAALRRKQYKDRLDEIETDTSGLNRQIANVTTPKTRKEEIELFVKHDMAKALAGDKKVRGAIQRLIANFAFTIKADKKGGFYLLFDGTESIHLPRPTMPQFCVRFARPKQPTRGDQKMIEGKLCTNYANGRWRAKDGTTYRVASFASEYRRVAETWRRGDIVTYDSRTFPFKGIKITSANKVEEQIKIPDGTEMRYKGAGNFQILPPPEPKKPTRSAARK